MISVNRLLKRKSNFRIGDWILDSGAFTRISQGKAHLPPETYVAQILRWRECGNLLAAVSQDWMCEPSVLQITGLSRIEHQEKTVERYQTLHRMLDGHVYLMPVLQGWDYSDYQDHIELYGQALAKDAWVGVGTLCKRNGSPLVIATILEGILTKRPDLRLHGFGLKTTALRSYRVARCLSSCDSMAWSYAARREGRNANRIEEAISFIDHIETQPIQTEFLFGN